MIDDEQLGLNLIAYFISRELATELYIKASSYHYQDKPVALHVLFVKLRDMQCSSNLHSYIKCAKLNHKSFELV